jgi:hypothetical protein
MRGSTLHLLPAVELGVWLSALGTHTNYENAGHLKIGELADAIDRVLDGRLLTREELALEVEQFTEKREVARSFRRWVRLAYVVLDHAT